MARAIAVKLITGMRGLPRRLRVKDIMIHIPEGWLSFYQNNTFHERKIITNPQDELYAIKCDVTWKI